MINQIGLYTLFAVLNMKIAKLEMRANLNRHTACVEIKQVPVRLVLVWLLGTLGSLLICVRVFQGVILSPACAGTSCVEGEGREPRRSHT